MLQQVPTINMEINTNKITRPKLFPSITSCKKSIWTFSTVDSIKKPKGILLYERYKYKTIKEVREYINYILTAKSNIKPNQVEEFELDHEINPQIPEIPLSLGPELSQYLSVLEHKNEGSII